MGSHSCSLGGAPGSQCPAEVNMSGSCSPLTSGALDEGEENNETRLCALPLGSVMSCL